MKKLTKKQKRIILIFSLSFFLLAAVATILFLTSKNKTSVPQKNVSSTDLAATKTEAVAFLEQKLDADNIKNEVLLEKLKENDYLAAGENSLREYIEGATTPEDLEIRKKNVLAIVEKITSSPGPSSPGPSSPGPSSPGPSSPGPSSPGPSSPGPSSPDPSSPGPSSPPTNK
jgi:hypothetical protein